jgi:hypothetical protein
MLLRWPLPLGVHAGDLSALANCRLVSLDDWIGRFGSGWKERQLGWATGLELSTLNLACLLSFVFVFWPNGTHLRQLQGDRACAVARKLTRKGWPLAANPWRALRKCNVHWRLCR